MSTVSQKKAKDLFHTAYLDEFGGEKDELRGLSNWALITDSGWFKVTAQKPCYADFTNRRSEAAKKSSYIGVFTQEGTYPSSPSSLTDKQRNRFYKFLMKEHPLSYTVVNTTLKYAREVGMLVKTDVPDNHAGYMMKAIRLAWEHPRIVADFYEYAKYAKTPEEIRMSFMLASTYPIERDRVAATPSHYSHNIFYNKGSTLRTSGSFVFTPDLNNPSYKTFKEKGGFEGSWYVFETDNGWDIVTAAVTRASEMGGEVVTVGTCPFTGNPISKATSKCTPENVMAAFREIQKERQQ